jgi:hypothetical protein
MSRRVSNNKKVVMYSSAFCHVCEKAGVPRTLYENHNFRDHRGKICCKRFLDNLRSHTCTECGKSGNHFSNQCQEPKKQQPVRMALIMVKAKENKKKADTPPLAVQANVFATLDEASDEEEEAPPHPNVTFRRKSKFIRNWADCESSDDEE